MKTFTVDSTKENWDLVTSRYHHEFNAIDARAYIVCRIGEIDTARGGKTIFIDKSHASKIQGAYLSHEDACGFVMLETLAHKMAYLKAINKEQKEKKQ